MENRKTFFYFIGILFLIMLSLFLFLGNSSKGTINGEIISAEKISGKTQNVVLSQDDLNYKDVKAKAGEPISISADNSVSGCLRSVVFNIGGKRYSKYLQTSKDTLKLPAISKGVYTFSCTMGMGYGKLIIE